jgi:hypothetical protein
VKQVWVYNDTTCSVRDLEADTPYDIATGACDHGTRYTFINDHSVLTKCFYNDDTCAFNDTVGPNSLNPSFNFIV